MIIQEMDRRESLELLTSGRLARLACVDNGVPYIVPVSLAFKATPAGDPCFYGVTTFGRKIRAMRSNPAVCFQVDEIRANDDWECVIVDGQFEELAKPAGAEQATRHPFHPDSLNRSWEGIDSSVEDERLEAYQTLASHAMWWDLAMSTWCAHTDHNPDDRYEPVYYRIRAEVISGRRARPSSGT